MPLFFSAVRAPPQSPVSVSCSQIDDAGLSFALAAPAKPTPIAAHATAAVKRRRKLFRQKSSGMRPPNRQTLTRRPGERLFRQIGELLERGKMRFINGWIKSVSYTHLRAHE